MDVQNLKKGDKFTIIGRIGGEMELTFVEYIDGYYPGCIILNIFLKEMIVFMD